METTLYDSENPHTEKQQNQIRSTFQGLVCPKYLEVLGV